MTAGPARRLLAGDNRPRGLQCSTVLASNDAIGSRPDPPLILVIEDNADLLDFYREVLEEEGFRVVPWAAPPAEPAYVATLFPNLIILDLLFDHADLGWQFLERLKADPATASVPVLVSAGDAILLKRVADRLAALTCGALLKPFELDQFLDRVRVCLGQVPGPSQPSRG